MVVDAEHYPSMGASYEKVVYSRVDLDLASDEKVS